MCSATRNVRLVPIADVVGASHGNQRQAPAACPNDGLVITQKLPRLEFGLSQEVQHGRISEAHRIALSVCDVTHDEQC